MSNFEKDLMQSKEIEQLFRNHPKFPFLKLEDDVEENVLLHLFWRYMIKPYQNQLSDEWEDYSWNYYQTFRIYDDTFLLMLHFYGKKLEGILPYVQLDTMKTDLMMIISELIPV